MKRRSPSKKIGGHTLATIYSSIFMASMILFGLVYAYGISVLFSTHREYHHQQELELLSTVVESALLGIHSSINQLASSSEAIQLSYYNISKDILEQEKAIEINQLIHQIRSTLLFNENIESISLYFNKSNTVYDQIKLYDAADYFSNVLHDTNAYFLWNSIASAGGYRNPLILRRDEKHIHLYQRLPLDMSVKGSGVLYAQVSEAMLDRRFDGGRHDFTALAILDTDGRLIYESNHTDLNFNYADAFSSRPADDGYLYRSASLSLDGLRLVAVYERFSLVRNLHGYTPALLLAAALGILMVFIIVRRQNRSHSDMLLATELDYTSVGIKDYKRIRDKLSANALLLQKYGNLPPLPSLQENSGEKSFPLPNALTVNDGIRISGVVLNGDYEGLSRLVSESPGQSRLYSVRSMLLRLASMYPSPFCRKACAGLLLSDTPDQVLDQGRLLCEYFESMSAGSSKLKSDIIDYIDAHIFEPGLSLKTLSSHFHVSNSFVTKVVGQVRGCGFLQYITERKLLRAKELLLNSDETIAFIAQKCNFNDSTTFITHFKEMTGMTPGEFRKKGAEGRGAE